MIEGSQKNKTAFRAAGQPAGNLSTVPRRRYFSSTEGPFQSANNIFLFYGGAGRSQLIDDITDQIRTLDEPVRVYGEHGSGKSMLSLVLAHRVQADYKVIHFDHRHCDFDRLLRQLLIELTPDLTHVGSEDVLLPHSAGKRSSARCTQSPTESNHLLVGRLLSRLQTGKVSSRPILLLVDSDVIDSDANDLVRQLTSIHNNQGRLVSTVLFLTEKSEDAVGELSVDQSNIDEGASQLQADLTAGNDCPHHRLRRLDLSETTEYLNHHMLLFDFNKRNLFTREMTYFIADRSDGNCNTINALARNAFLHAYLEGEEHINMRHLLVAGLPKAEEKPLQFLQKYKRAVSLISLFAVSSLALIAVIALFLS